MGWVAPEFAWWALHFVRQVSRPETVHISEKGLAGSQEGEARGGDTLLKHGLLLWESLSLGWCRGWGICLYSKSLRAAGTGGGSSTLVPPMPPTFPVAPGPA